MNVCRLKAARRSRLYRLALCAAAAAHVPQVFADQLSWVGGTGDWLDASNWIDTTNGLNQLPTAADNVSIQNGGTAQFNSSTAKVVTGTLTIDLNSTMVITNSARPSGSILGNDQYVGSSGAGTLIQTGGFNEPYVNLYIAQNSGSAGTYALSGIGILSTNFEYVGSAGQGNFIQTGAGNFLIELTVDGSNADHTAGSYSLSGTGSISSDIEWVGYNGPGNFNQTAGLNQVIENLYLGENSGSSGTYSLSGTGSLSVATLECVGYGGIGTFIQSAGVNSITEKTFGELVLGQNSGSAGTYILSGTGSLSVAGFEVVNSFGNFIQTGGVNSTGDLSVGGAYSLSGTASLSVASAENVSGAFIQSGGVNSTHSLRVDTDNSLGSYTLSGNGSLSVSLTEIVGYSGLGIFTQSGGTNAIAGTLTISNNPGIGSNGTYNLQDGTLSAGTLQVNTDGTINYNGGTLLANRLTVSGGQVLLGPGHNRALNVGTIMFLYGLIDLNDNGMIVDYPDGGLSPVNSIRSLIQNNQIISSAANPTHGLGYGDNSVLGLSSFFGQSVDSSSVLVMYTYFGDANLDGTVDPADVKMLAEHWNTSGNTWSNGDFNGDGNVDVSDLYLLAQNWGAGTSSLPQLGPLLTSLGLPDVTVPEPAIGISLLMLLLPRRRRRRQ